MSKSPRSSTILHDVAIASNLRDGCDIVAKRRYRELTSYIFQDSICPLQADFKKQIEPKTVTPSEIERSFENFSNLYKTQFTYFRQIPIFTLLYVSRCMPNKILFKMAIDFISNYLSTITVPISADILDILIPFAVYRQYIQDNPPVIVPFINFLSDYFTPSKFLPHLLKCLSTMIEEKIIGHFHVDLVFDLYEKNDFSKKESEKIASAVLEPLNDSNTVSLHLACETLKKAIQKKTGNVSLLLNSSNSNSNNISLSTSLSSGLSSPRSPQSPRSIGQISPRSLNKLNLLLDDIENSSYGSATSILTEIKQQLDFIEEFPQRSPRPLFELALRTWYNASDTHKNMIFLLVLKLNQICDPSELLQIYVSLKFDKSIPIDLLEECYQNFMSIARNAQRPTLPATLFDADNNNNYYNHNNNNNNNNDESSEINIRDKSPSTIELRKALEMLSTWDSAYEGVVKVWNLIEKNPDIHLQDYFDELEYANKSYLVQGLRAIEEEKARDEAVSNAIYKLEIFLEKRTPKAVSMLDASVDLGSSPDNNNRVFQTQNMNPSSLNSTTPQSSSSMRSPVRANMNELSSTSTPTTGGQRKRIVSNGASLKTGNYSQKINK